MRTGVCGNKKAGNARRRLLAYSNFACIEAMRNGKAHFAQFPMIQKSTR